ncbi:MAG: hypothetical protein ACYCVZ_01310 [Streptosporangiaceae bacterium]
MSFASFVSFAATRTHASASSGTMTFPQHLVLWLHVAFAIFAIGPVTLAISSTPRYIRQRDVRVVRYLSRMTLVFTIICLGVLIAGMFLAQMLSESAKPWVIISATLFLVAILLLVLIIRDQRKAIKAMEAEESVADPAGAGAAVPGPTPAAGAGTAAAGPAAAAAPGQPEPAPQGPAAQSSGAQSSGAQSSGAQGPAGQGAAGQSPATPKRSPSAIATVERGRIAMAGGVVSLIWLVILVLMIWNGS